MITAQSIALDAILEKLDKQARLTIKEPLFTWAECWEDQ